MRIGLQVMYVQLAGQPAEYRLAAGEIARAADDAGFSSLWVMDHFFQMESFSDPHDPMLESYTAQSFMAAQTKQIKHGVMVTGGFYRHPGILIKTVTRSTCCRAGAPISASARAGTSARRTALGVPFPPTGERLARLERDLADRATHVERRRIALQRQILPACRADQPPAAVEQAAPADSDRRRRREEDAAAGRAVRRRLQPVRRRRTAWIGCGTSSTCSSSTAPTWGGITTRSRRPRSAGSTAGEQLQPVIDYLPRHWRRWASIRRCSICMGYDLRRDRADRQGDHPGGGGALGSGLEAGALLTSPAYAAKLRFRLRSAALSIGTRARHEFVARSG